jgi:hypothetical protein
MGSSPKGEVVKFTGKRLLQRIAAGLLAMMTASSVLVGASTAEASAASAVYVHNAASGKCLVDDYSSKVYTYSACNGNGTWVFQEVLVEPDVYTFYVKSTNTGNCLFQNDYTHVITKPCGTTIGFIWEEPWAFGGGDPDFMIRSYNTGYNLRQNATTGVVYLADPSVFDYYSIWSQ